MDACSDMKEKSQKRRATLLIPVSFSSQTVKTIFRDTADNAILERLSIGQNAIPMNQTAVQLVFAFRSPLA